MIEKWRITGWLSLGVLMTAIVIFAIHGINEEGIRSFVRVSAQISVVLFLSAFTASSLQMLFHRNWSAWLLRNRRYVGVSFAISHSMHFAALILLAIFFPHPFVDKLTPVSIVFGLLAYLVILSMAVTSFDTPRRAMGEKGWKRLHLYGSWYLWVLFTYSYLPRALKDGFYIPFAIAIFLALGLRMARFVKRRANRSVTASP